ncbi:MAG: hypothetical protein HY690_01515 [Chloroflexi bacterium]|nr:hypothetical protein [Chloroflexota bacterium]
MPPTPWFRRLSLVILVGVLPLLAGVPLPLTGSRASAAPAPTPIARPPDPKQVGKTLASSGPLFVENVGQFDPRARFQVRGLLGTVHLAEDGIWVMVVERSSPTRGDAGAGPNPPAPFPAREGGAGQGPGRHPSPGRGGAGGEVRRGVHLKLSYDGANPRPRMEGITRRDTVVSYFFGNDPARWRPDVSVWGGVRYVDIYPGVDLELSAEAGRLVQRFVVRDLAGGAQGLALLRQARLRVEGSSGLALADDSRLAVATEIGNVRLELAHLSTANGFPLSLGEALGARSVEGTMVRLPFAPAPSTPMGARTAAASDLLYATFLGGSDSDGASDIAVDAAGAAYVTGETRSTDFPTTAGVFDPSHNGDRDVFVAKLNPTGSGLEYATFLGGSGRDRVSRIAVDGAGSAYLIGFTPSATSPPRRAPSTRRSTAARPTPS